MKNLTVAFLCFMSMATYGQDSKVEFDGEKWKAPYFFDIIAGEWGVERFPFPISFAPDIPYQGVEDVRFTPGWGNSKSDEYWSYTFLWFLDGKPETTSKIIERNLQLYYTGLIGRNIERRNIPTEKVFTPKTAFQEIKTVANDLKTFQGTIYMLDYMEQKPITLNCIVHLKSCPNQENKTFIFYEISPKPLMDIVWEKLDKVCSSFSCNK